MCEKSNGCPRADGFLVPLTIDNPDFVGQLTMGIHDGEDALLLWGGPCQLSIVNCLCAQPRAKVVEFFSQISFV